MESKVAVVGAGQSKYGESVDKSVKELFLDAYIELINSVDNGLEPREINAVYIGSLGSGGFQLGNLSALMAEYVGLPGVHAVRIENACSSSGFAFIEACLAIMSGMYDVVIAGGVEKMRDVSSLKAKYWLGVSGDTEYERLAGMTFAGLYAIMANRHMHDYGTTREQLSMVAVKNHKNAFLNPKAQFQNKITLEKAMNSPMVAYPLNLFDCCPTTDGASAVLLCKAEIAKKFTDSPVYVAGFGTGTDYLALHDRETITSLKAAVLAAREAYKKAGIKPKDVDVAEVHDCFTIAEIIAYEDLGFCERGEGGKFIEEGLSSMEGEIPVNLSGGLKAKGHPIGATGTGQVYEIFNQLRKTVQKPARQVKDAEIGLTHNVGGSGGTAAVTVFKV